MLALLEFCQSSYVHSPLALQTFDQTFVSQPDSNVAVFFGTLNGSFTHIYDHDIPLLLGLEELAFTRKAEDP